jgi:hypothetical protein
VPPRGSGLPGGDIITRETELSKAMIDISGLQYGFFDICGRILFKSKRINSSYVTKIDYLK